MLFFHPVILMVVPCQRGNARRSLVYQCTMQWKNMFARIRVLVEVGKRKTRGLFQNAHFLP